MAERREREPKQVGDLLRTMVAGRGWNERMSLQRLRAEWPAVVGEHLASHTSPVKLFRNTLTVYVEGGTWAAEVTLLARSIATKAETFLGPGSVSEVRVSAGADRPSERPS